MSIVFGNEHGNGFSEVSSVHSRPSFLTLNDSLVGMKNNHGGKIAIRRKTQCIAFSVDF